MKAICIIASDKVVIDGDVIFNKPNKSGTKFGWIAQEVCNLTIKNSWYVEVYSRRLGFRLSVLWFWYMVVLQKSHVYLTGALR